jgi:hypothetical protein
MENRIFESEKNKPQESSEVDLLYEFARDANLKNIALPKMGTVAHSRLWEICKEYSKEVHFEMVSREANPSESQSRRRMLHNQLCIMLFGLDYASVEKRDPEDLKRIANLAHLVSGREQYIQE